MPVEIHHMVYVVRDDDGTLSRWHIDDDYPFPTGRAYDRTSGDWRGVTDDEYDTTRASLTELITPLDPHVTTVLTSIDQISEALNDFIATIEATGGLTRTSRREPVPYADEDWPDLADAYLKACQALGREPMWNND
jgi:hypothetical protein